jgi:beta-mannosidase
MQGEVVKQDVKQVSLPALSAGTYMQLPLESLAKGDRDLTQMFVVADLTVGGAEVSRNVLYLAPTKQVKLPPAKIQSGLTQDHGLYRFKLSSSVLARDVYVTLGDLDGKISDNYFDLIPGEPAEITITSTATLAEIQKQLKVVSLTDALATETAKADGPAK